jgi:hypothetical protein
VALMIEAQGMTHTLHGDCNILSFHPFFSKQNKSHFQFKMRIKSIVFMCRLVPFPFLFDWKELIVVGSVTNFSPIK